jgi:hypothetical protein
MTMTLDDDDERGTERRHNSILTGKCNKLPLLAAQSKSKSP